MRKITLLIILLLNACDNALEQKKHKEMSNAATLPAKKVLEKAEREKTPNVDSALSLKKEIKLKESGQSKVVVRRLPASRESVNEPLQSRVSRDALKNHGKQPQLLQKTDAFLSIVATLGEGSGALELLEDVAVEGEVQALSMDLDLSLNLDVIEHNSYLKSKTSKLLQGFFNGEEGISSFRLEAHFEGPHNENKERDTTPDGVGVGIEIGI